MPVSSKCLLAGLRLLCGMQFVLLSLYFTQKWSLFCYLYKTILTLQKKKGFTCSALALELLFDSKTPIYNKIM
jgi:hypothetical protein